MNATMIQNNEDYFYVKIQNGGGFFAEAYIDYMYNGRIYSWNSGIITLGFSRSTNIPSKAKKVHLTIKVWLYRFESTVFFDYLRTAEPYCFYLYGTMFYPVCVRVPCNNIEAIPPSNNSNCCCCNSECCNSVYSSCCNNMCPNCSNDIC